MTDIEFTISWDASESCPNPKCRSTNWVIRQHQDTGISWPIHTKIGDRVCQDCVATWTPHTAA